MNLAPIDALTRTPATDVARRSSIASLVAVGVAAVTRHQPVAAKKRNSNKKAKKKCKQQIGQCTTVIADACNGDPDCLDQIVCCELVGRCDMSGFLNCLDS